MRTPDLLIEDTRRLMIEASRRGLLPAQTLLDEIPVLAQKHQGGRFTLDDEVRLNKIINILAKSIKPTKIEHLTANFKAVRDRFSPIAIAAGILKHPFLTPSIIFFICVCIILVIVPMTMHFNRLAVITTELKATEDQNYLALLRETRVLSQLVQKNRINNKETDFERNQTDLGLKFKKLQEMDGKIFVNQLFLNQTINIHDGTPKWFDLVLASYGFSRARDDEIISVRKKGSLVGATESVDQANFAKPIETKNESRSDESRQHKCHDDDDLCNDINYADALGLTIVDPGQVRNVILFRRQAEAVGVLLGGSFLPLLYGLLGASVYLLRRFLGLSEGQGTTPLLRPGMTSYLRLGLGGIAGLAIGWFWVPTSAKAVTEVANLTTAPFALAFVAGFSIDLLFSILDRIIAAITPAAITPSPTATGNTQSQPATPPPVLPIMQPTAASPVGTVPPASGTHGITP